MYAVAMLLLAAHFVRSGEYWLVVGCVLMPLLFFLRSRWSVYVLQLVAYLAVMCWIDAAVQIVSLRWRLGQPWLLAGAIMLAVTLFTAVAGLLLNSAAIRRRYF